MKIALFQRVCPHYRVPVFKKLARQNGIDITVFFGRGRRQGPFKNAPQICDFNHKRLFSIPFKLSIRDREYFFPLHPTIPYELFKENYAVIITEGATNIINDILIFLVCKFKKIPFIWWGAENIEGDVSLIHKIMNPLIKFIIRHSDACISYGTLGKDYFISIGVKPESVFIAQNSIDVKKIQKEIIKFENIAELKRESLGVKDKKVILCTCSITKRKKIENLLLAFRDIVKDDLKVTLFIIGEGPHRNYLIKYAKDLSIPNVNFLGSIWKEAPVYYLLSDLFVLPSHGGLAINEAMAYGLPVVASVADGTEKDLIQQGENGFIVKENDVTALKEVIKRILNDDELKKKMSKSSRTLISRNFNLENMVKGIVDAIFWVAYKKTGLKRDNFKLKPEKS